MAYVEQDYPNFFANSLSLFSSNATSVRWTTSRTKANSVSEGLSSTTIAMDIAFNKVCFSSIEQFAKRLKISSFSKFTCCEKFSISSILPISWIRMINAETTSLQRRSFTMADNNINSKKTENEKKEEQETPQSSNEHKEDTPATNELVQIRSDVNKLSDDLQTTVTDLKKSIVDIRSAVSEIENPFNLLRTISSEKDLKKINGKRLPPGVQSLIVGKPQEDDAANGEIKEDISTKDIETQTLPEPEPQTKPKTETEEEKPEKEAQLAVQSKPPKGNPAYIDWIWGLLDSGLKASDIQQLACSCEFLGYLPTQTNEFIYSLALAAEKFRGKGLTKGHMMLNLYKAATISKVKVSWEDVEALIAITENQLKRPKSAKGTE